MATTASPAEKTSVWEDFVDIFYAPTSVFARRRDGKFGLALLVYVVLTTAVLVVARPLMQPIFDTMASQQMAKARSDNPQITEDQLRQGQEMQEKMTTGPIGAVFFGVSNTVIVLVTGFVLFLVAKLFDSKASAGQAAMVATYAFYPRMLGALVGAALLYITPPEQLTSMASMSLSPARFVDGVAQPVLAAVLGRFDLFVIWGTILLGLGISVVGKIPRSAGLMAALVVWLLASLSTVGQAWAANA